MNLTVAMLADAAQVQGGKLYVMGGAFDTINAPAVPVVHRSWAIALVAEVGPSERQQDLSIHATLVDEDDQPVGLEMEAQLRVGAPAVLRPGDVSIVPLAITLPEVSLPAAKGYSFHITQEDRELARVPFRVHLAQ